ncbi:Transcription elongation factor spt6 [Ceratobasidium sp. 395]|nr:Transcription elongation factor spt6 [Ceratobasidium sp. 395]
MPMPRDTHPTAEDALVTARMIIATELGRDPWLRETIRMQFREQALLSCEPTAKGKTKIDEAHACYAFKFLVGKPAESEPLNVTVTTPPARMHEITTSLENAYASDSFSDSAKAWNEQRRAVIDEALKKHLIPQAMAWTKEWLQDEVEEHLAGKAAEQLEKRVNAAPCRPKDLAGRDDVPSVIAMSWGQGEPNRDPIHMVFLDEEGRFREHLGLDNISDSDNRQEFLDLLKRRKPDVIVISGFTTATKHLMGRVREALGLPDLEPDAAAAPAPGGAPTSTPTPVGATATTPLGVVVAVADGVALAATKPAVKPTMLGDERLPEVMYGYDEVARIYQHSPRAEAEFSALPLIARYCVSMARYVQSPLNEYAALGSDLAVITYIEAQHLDVPDPLDETRIHCEDYDLARKMAVDALEIDNEDVVGKHPSVIVYELMQRDDNHEQRAKATHVEHDSRRAPAVRLENNAPRAGHFTSPAPGLSKAKPVPTAKPAKNATPGKKGKKAKDGAGSDAERSIATLSFERTRFFCSFAVFFRRILPFYSWKLVDLFFACPFLMLP